MSQRRLHRCLHYRCVDSGLIGILASLAYLQRRAVRLVGDVEELDARRAAYRTCAAAARWHAP
ncbi:hypothetical protein H0178_49665 [Cytobacillus firmus]|nr:hypothetical protein [Cytobacillus firmus]